MESAQMKTFGSFGDFALHLGELALVQHEADKVALERCATMIEHRAKDKIGEYQEQAGPFIAWPELAESTKADRAAQGYPEDEPLLRTGEMRDSIEHFVADGEAHVGSNNDIAVWQELGTDRIPPRSFLGGAAAELSDKVAEVIGETVTLALTGAGVHQGRMLIED
jgi:phage gpG-like protein